MTTIEAEIDECDNEIDRLESLVVETNELYDTLVRGCGWTQLAM